MADNQQSRFEKSLGLLTTRFVSLLQKARDGVLDLKVVRGAGPGCNTQEMSERLITLKKEISRLEDHEKKLDTHKQWLQQSFNNIADDVENCHLAYVTSEDICKCFEGDTMLTIKAPNGTSLEVPHLSGQVRVQSEAGGPFQVFNLFIFMSFPSLISSIGQIKYQIHLKSSTGPILVTLINKDAESETPISVLVPPVKVESSLAKDTPKEVEPVAKAVEAPATRSTRLRSSPQKGAVTSSSHMPASTSQVEEAPRAQSPMGLKRKRGPGRPPKHPRIEAESPKEELDMEPDVILGDVLSGTCTSDVKLSQRDSELMEELMCSDYFGPLVRLSPPPNEKDYYFNLGDNEGVCDLFDIPLMSM
uniref:(California timema) hypothetical protein n=1 Tax=Timema californicum TaxID=61474 RepID=A0A7R9IZK7_TIMCA|nr:unnamed protein product [Timema californicum]